jgi:RND family efflux transporter MFP subunit
MSIDIDTEMTEPSTDYTGTAVAAQNPRPDAAPKPRRSLPTGVWVAGGCVAALLAATIIYGLFSRAAEERHLTQTTHASAVLTVSVVHPTITGTASEIALPGNTQAYNDTPIYARTSGYLKQWFVDIGGHVQQGQLMAIIETPEVDQQLQVAEANLKSAQADLSLANTTSERYQNLLKSDSVSKQETDVAVSGAAAKLAAVDAAQANVRRLQQLQSFERVYAPFAGVVTVRNTDIGALIDAGSSSGTAPKELFRIASVDRLRVFVAVPETYAPAIRDGNTATLTLDEYPGQQFTGTIARNSSAIDPASRTLNVEVDVNNLDGKLLPGAYAFVHFKIPDEVRLLSVPANALLFRAEGLRIAVVRNGRAHLTPITIGKDNGATLEIATGLSAEDEIILDPSDSLIEGQQVTVTNNSGVKR